MAPLMSNIWNSFGIPDANGISVSTSIGTVEPFAAVRNAAC